ncbi:MAG: diaminopimelate epimerase [Buchnera aphidicola (Chaetogeoica yunlongensis)]
MINENSKLKFSKMHGLGNDFIVIDMIRQNVSITQTIVKNLSNRYTGIGFDQLLLVDYSKNANADFHYRIFNSNGIEVTQCGNGARCLALFILLNNLSKKTVFSVHTNINSILILKILDNKNVCVNMGIPSFEPNDIPYLIQYTPKPYTIKIFDYVLNFDVVSIGNPHCIIYVNNLDAYPVQKIGSMLSIHKSFPKEINVSFVEILSLNNISIRVYERGVGETLSCGSAACAAVAIGINKGLLRDKVKVRFLKGCLDIMWKGGKNGLYMIGSATHVYDGYVNLCNFL